MQVSLTLWQMAGISGLLITGFAVLMVSLFAEQEKLGKNIATLGLGFVVTLLAMAAAVDITRTHARRANEAQRSERYEQERAIEIAEYDAKEAAQNALFESLPIKWQNLLALIKEQIATEDIELIFVAFAKSEVPPITWEEKNSFLQKLGRSHHAWMAEQIAPFVVIDIDAMLAKQNEKRLKERLSPEYLLAHHDWLRNDAIATEKKLNVAILAEKEE